MTVRGEPGGAAVHARGWSWRHAGRRAWAVSDLDLSIEPGERVLLLGASGAGKSTVLHALAGVLGGDDDGESRGELTVDGRSPTDARGRVGLLLQDPDSQVILARVGDDVAFGCENLRLPREEIWRRVTESLDAVGLHLPLEHPTSALSGGQKQRLALAGVLAMRPGLLLLDEPTANLDSDGVREVRDAVGRVLDHSTATLVVVEHRVDVWRDLVDRVIVLAADGGVLADGSPHDVLTRQGAALAESGIWIPEHPPEHPDRSGRAASASLPGAALIRADRLSIARTPGQPLASGLDFDISQATATAITGPNGAGKSTLGLTLGGLLPPAAGRVRAAPELADGAHEQPIRWRSRELLTRIGTVFQDPEHQFVASTVRAELEVGPRALGLPDAETAVRVGELLERLRLTRLAEANPFTLSGGEKRRLSVATALATRPRILILDEPTFGQDSRTWRELVHLLAGLVDGGAAVVAITHDDAFVAALADTELRMPTVPERRGSVAPVNPVAKLATALILSVALVLSIDWVSATVALVLEIPLFLWAGLSLRTFLLRTLPVWIAAPGAAVTIALYGQASGETHFTFLLITVSDGSLALALATFLRILAIGLPAVVLFVTVDPTDLADGLGQIVRLPSRFVLGALAGIRLVGLFVQDWRSLELARRARGIADTGRVRRFLGQAFALLVLSIRRGSKLATAMEARGFGASNERTWARPSTLGVREFLLMLAGVAIAATAITVSVMTGNWNFIVG